MEGFQSPQETRDDEEEKYVRSITTRGKNEKLFITLNYNSSFYQWAKHKDFNLKKIFKIFNITFTSLTVLISKNYLKITSKIRNLRIVKKK